MDQGSTPKIGFSMKPQSGNEMEKNQSQRTIDIKYPGIHDVLCGRGGGSNNHVGNVRFRSIVSEHKSKYFVASRHEKNTVASQILKIWKCLDPPGRFLAISDCKSAEDTTWYVIEDKQALKKVSQCLRERIPTERAAHNITPTKKRVGTLCQSRQVNKRYKNDSVVPDAGSTSMGTRNVSSSAASLSQSAMCCDVHEDAIANAYISRMASQVGGDQLLLQRKFITEKGGREPQLMSSEMSKYNGDDIGKFGALPPAVNIGFPLPARQPQRAYSHLHVSRFAALPNGTSSMDDKLAAHAYLRRLEVESVPSRLSLNFYEQMDQILFLNKSILLQDLRTKLSIIDSRYRRK